MSPMAAWHDRDMTVVKINAITVPPEGGDELARRFAARAGAVDNQDGFEGFELLRPTDDRTTWLVVTRWRDEAAFQAWVTSPAFGQGHRQAAEAAAQAHAASSHGAGGPHDAGPHGPGEAGPHGKGGAGQHKPVAVSSELWSFEIAGGAPGAS
jgi:heme oxygenase (mycobilin-producing)